MKNNDAPSPILFFQTLSAYQKSAALKAAIDLDLFSAIGTKPARASEVAQRIGAAQRGVRILCDYLTILGFLEKKEGQYCLTSDSAAFLVRTSPSYAGSAAEFLLSPTIAGAFADLTRAVRKGGTAQSEEGTMAPEHPVWLSFARGMVPVAMPAARMLTDLVSLDQTRPTKVLDVSASHGIYGIAFAQKNPRAAVVAVDWAPVLQVARENAAKMGVADRYSTLEGSAFEVDLGNDYDLVLVPNFLHHFDPSTCTNFLRKLHGALRAKGKVAIVEFVPNEDRITPPDVAHFSLVMLATTAHGDAYTLPEFKGMLSQAGFGEIEAHALQPRNATTIIATAL